MKCILTSVQCTGTPTSTCTGTCSFDKAASTKAASTKLYQLLTSGCQLLSSECQRMSANKAVSKYFWNMYQLLYQLYQLLYMYLGMCCTDAAPAVPDARIA